MDSLVCRFCGKPAKSKSGLTNHEKVCENRPALVDETDVDMAEVNPYDTISDEPQHRRQHNNNGSKPSAPKQNPFQFGAFLVMADYVPILLDVDFCIALGNHLLEHGCANSAIMAFAHQLNKFDEE
jgi:hypothetical protein